MPKVAISADTKSSTSNVNVPLVSTSASIPFIVKTCVAATAATAISANYSRNTQ